MRILSALTLALLAALPGAPGAAASQAQTTPALKGYVRNIAGEQIDYNCFNPLATTALLTRCTTGEMAIEWETENIPAAAAGESVSFVWIVSYSTTTSSGDRDFDFSVNGRKTFTIHTVKGLNEKEWRLRAADGSILSFRFVAEDAARDANGYMTLTVPLALYRKGEPLRLRVVGEKANSSDWFMTFMYDMRGKNVEVLPLPFLEARADSLRQSLCVAVTYLGEAGTARISVDGGAGESRPLERGANTFMFSVPALSTPRDVPVTVSVDGEHAESFVARLKPVMRRTVYLLPHAHNDIGYTNIQTEVLKRHVQNIYDALALIRKTASYPPAARFRWNIEVIWAVETFMKEASPSAREEFLRALREGSICMEALYANVLTGIMRPEEFYRVTAYARSFREKYNVPLNTAMISDIPGMTWNMVPALAQAGIRYFSAGPNGMYTGGDRTGHTNAAWSDRPFYWVSPSGDERLLYWMAGYGYASFLTGPRDPGSIRFLRSVAKYFDYLDGIGYPYDMIQMRHTFNGDNGTVDPGLPDYVRQWNATHVSPKLAIATTEELFAEFEKKYGTTLPSFRGDFTPYWEDGAASTAYELGVNRTSAERLIQAGALYAILAPARYSPSAFTGAWRNVVLFDEHTWGAFNSTSDPDSPFVLKQWEIKKRFATDGERQSGDLLAGIAPVSSGSSTIDVVNTNSWERTDLVLLSRDASAAGDVVVDGQGAEVPSQRLNTGELAFLARGVPALGGKRYTVRAGTSSYRSGLRVEGETLVDENMIVRVAKSTGEISSLKTLAPPVEYVDTAGGHGLDGYFYVAGLDAREAMRSAHPLVAAGERGPLVASLVVTSDAPGCNSLRREYRMVSGLGRLEVINTIDKKRVRTDEGVHLGFPFAVPGGTARVDLGYAVMRPEADQLPGSCKDYYSAQRWADVSNQDYGVTLTVSEAPLVEMGELHSELPAPRNVDWKTFRPYSSHLASYVMNNYWYTNYKADQEGISTYHYAIIPHGLFNQADVARRGIEWSQPLIVRSVNGIDPEVKSPFMLSPGGIIVTLLEPVEAGKACLVRLFNAGGSPETASFSFPGGRGSAYLSGLDEKRGARIGRITLPANGIATLLVEGGAR